MKEPERDDFLRLPGLYRAWELGEIMAPGRRYRIESAGLDAGGMALIAVFAAPVEPAE